MKNRFLTRIFSVIALLVVSLIAVGCAGNETSPARDKAKEQVNNLLNIDFAETKDNVVLEPVTGNVAIATDEDGKVSEKDLANNTYSEFAGGVVAEYSSSHPEIMDAQWVVTLVRDYQYAEDGTTVVGITKKSVYNLVFVVNRPAEDTQVTITITGSKVYEDEGIEYKYTKSREIVFTVKAKEQLEAVEMSIAEINAYANANWAEFSKNGIVDENGNKVQVVTTGVVTEVLWGDGYTNHSFMISDGEESFYVYAPKGDVVELGDLVQVVCTPTYYYSIIETASGPQVTVLLNGQQVPAAKEYTVDEWYAAYPNGSDFHDCPGQRVAITGVLKHNGTNYVLESNETGKKFEVYYKGYTAYEESLIKANLGKLVKMEAAIYDYHSQGYYRLLANVYDYPMEVLTLSGQAALDADASTITKEFTVKEGETISLPTSFPNGSTLSAWTADKEGHINLSTLVCTLGSAKEDVTVTLTATLSNGSYSTTVSIVVKLDYVAPAQKEYEVVTNLELGVPYKYVVNQETIGKVLYFAGSLDAQGKYLTSTEAASDGVDVYLEAAAGGYYMYFLNAGVKTYINMAADGSKLALEAAPSNVWVYNAQYNTLFTTVNEKEYFVGMYSTFETFSRSQTSYLANAGNFAAQFYAEKTGSQGPVTPEVPEGQISLKEAVEIASKQEHNTYTSEKYTVTGTVSDLYNTVYGNMHLIDAEGNDLTIYGLYIEGSKYGDYAGSKPVEGDVITVTGILGTYNGKPQMKNAELVVSSPEVPSHQHTACPTCGKCTAEDCTGEKCEGHSDSPEVPSDSTTVKVNIADYAAANGWANSTMYNTLTMNDKVTVTMSAVAGSGSYPANTGKYYSTGSTWRAYQSDTEATIVVEANGLTIVSVKFTYAAQNNGSIVFNGKNVATDEVVTVNATSATFTIGNTGSATNGQARITAIEVVYGAAGSTEPEVPTHEHVACPTCGKCTAEDCTGAAEDKCAGHVVEPELPEGQISLKEAIEIANKQAHNTYTSEKYTVTGTVSDLYNTVYGNMHLIDAEGNDLTIYGLYMNGVRYDAMENKPVEGDVITVNGILGTYNGKPQMKNAELVVTSAVCEHEGGKATCKELAVCTKCGQTYGELGDHVWDDRGYSYNDEKHWVDCVVCQAAKNNEAAHDFSNGNCVCGKEAPATPDVPEGQISLKEAIEIANKQAHNTYTSEKYTVTGTVSDLYNTVYGNMHLIDAEGNDLTIYGLYMNGVRYDAMENKPVEGDVITVNGILGTYNGKPQMKNAELVVTPAEPEVPTHEHVACPTCGKCTAEDCTGAAEDKCAGHVVEPELPEGQISLKEAVEIASKQAHNTYTTEKYTVTGTVSDLYNTVYGNMHLIDAEGNDLTIYGLYMNGVRYDAMENKPVEGDVITVTGILGTYNGTPQMKNAELVASGSNEPDTPEVPSHEHTACPTCGKCTAEDCTGEKCEGHTETPDTPEVPGESTTVSVSIADYAAANGWANSTMYNTLVMNDKVTVTMSAVAGSGSYPANTGKYYASGSTWRAYQSDTEATIVVEANGLTIVSVKISYQASNTGSIVFNGNNVATDEVVNVNATSATFTIGNTGSATNGQARVTAIEVVYSAGSTSEEPEVHEHEYVPTVTAPTCYTDGYTTYACACGESYQDNTVPATNEHVDTNLDITCDTEGCTKRILPAADSKVSLFTAKHMIIISLSNSYYVEGVVTEIFDAKNGVFAIRDEAGDEILVRLPKNAEGTSYASWTDLKVCLGDTIEVYGKPTRNTSSTYPQEAKVEGGVLRVLKHEHNFSEATCIDPSVCGCLVQNSEALGHIDADSNKLCDRCQFDLTLSIEKIVVATDPALANGVLDSAETFWTWAGNEFDVIIAKGTSTFTIYKTAKAYMQFKKLNTITVDSKNGVEIKTITFFVTTESYLNTLKTAFAEFNFTANVEKLSLTVEWNSAEDFVGTNKATSTVYISGVEVLYKVAGAVEPEVPTHEHTACAECGKCTAEDCTGAEEEKCAGHPVHEHVACAECGKCTAEDCTGAEEEKCAGHEVVAPVETTYVLDCAGNFGSYASAWDTAYKARTITFAQLGVADLAGTLVLSNANKQTGTITDRPVMASKSSATQYATVSVETGTISSVTFVLAQWTTKKFKTLTIEYTTDGTNWVATNVGVVNGSAVQADAHSPLTATLPEGVVAVRFAFLGSTTSNNQVGLTSVEFTHKA